MPAGRPTDYTAEVAEVICERIATGEALHRMCLELALPSERTVYRWLEQHEEFRQSYIRARDRQADRHFEEVVLISDEEDDPQKARVRIDARKWAAAKLAPKKYGDRVQNVHTGEDGGPVKVMIEGDDKGLL